MSFLPTPGLSLGVNQQFNGCNSIMIPDALGVDPVAQGCFLFVAGQETSLGD